MPLDFHGKLRRERFEEGKLFWVAGEFSIPATAAGVDGVGSFVSVLSTSLCLQLAEVRSGE